MMRNDLCLVCLATLLFACATATFAWESRDHSLAKPGLVPQTAYHLDRLFGHGLHQYGQIPNGRTFGHKRIQFMLMPMIYKMGVMMTMLVVLTAISLKGLTIGVILLLLKLSSLFAKFYTGWQPQGYVHGHEWSSPSQPVHVHVHSDAFHQQAYGGWPSSHDDGHYYYKG